jgi:putative ABC transport system substrate-binding protein
MLNVADPIGAGIITSLSHPGGNITGVVQDESPEITTKRLQLLKDAVPQATKVAVLLNPDHPYAHAEWEQLARAARVLNLAVRPLVVRQANEFETAFANLEQDRPDALFVTSSGLNFSNRKPIMELALKSRLPALATSRESAEAGGLLSYSSNRAERYRLAAIYVGKILKGSEPGNLPVEQATNYELVINLKTAGALNLEIPRSLLLIADELIE